MAAVEGGGEWPVPLAPLLSAPLGSPSELTVHSLVPSAVRCQGRGEAAVCRGLTQGCRAGSIVRRRGSAQTAWSRSQRPYQPPSLDPSLCLLIDARCGCGGGGDIINFPELYHRLTERHLISHSRWTGCNSPGLEALHPFWGISYERDLSVPVTPKREVRDAFPAAYLSNISR